MAARVVFPQKVVLSMPDMDDNGVVITGCGWVTPEAAGNIDDVLAAMPEGPADQAVPSFRAVTTDRLATEIDLPKELVADHGAHIAAVALLHACRDARLDLSDVNATRVGVVIGCGLAGQEGMIRFAEEVREQSPRFVSPIHFPQTVGNYIAGALARGFHITGPNLTLAGGPRLGLDTVLEAMNLIQSGQADVLVAGGVDTFSPRTARSFSPPDTRPADGACLLVLESCRHAAMRHAPVRAALSLCERDPGPAGASWPRATVARAAPGAVFVQGHIGYCPGAVGPASIAAVLGAFAGAAVPIAARIGTDHVELAYRSLTFEITPDGTGIAVIGTGLPEDPPALLRIDVHPTH